MSVFAMRSNPSPVMRSERHASVGRNLIESFLRNWRFWRASRAMEGLDDQALKDIGVPRAAIDHAVRHGRLGVR